MYKKIMKFYSMNSSFNFNINNRMYDSQHKKKNKSQEISYIILSSDAPVVSRTKQPANVGATSVSALIA